MTHLVELLQDADHRRNLAEECERQANVHRATIPAIGRRPEEEVLLMRAYGVEREDRGCCPDHDKVPRDTYENRRSKRAHTRDTKKARRRERRTAKVTTVSAASVEG